MAIKFVRFGHYLSKTIEVYVLELTSDNSLKPYRFLIADPAWRGEAGLIEDLNQEHQNNKDILNEQSQ